MTKRKQPNPNGKPDGRSTNRGRRRNGGGGNNRSDSDPGTEDFKPLKYDPDKLEHAVDLLRESGDLQTVKVLFDISDDTYYTWRDRIPDFRKAIDTGLTEYRRTQAAVLVPLAKASVLRYLTEGQVERWEDIVETYDKDGNLTGTMKRKRTVRRNTPKWVIDRIVPLTTTVSKGEGGETKITSGSNSDELRRVLSETLFGISLEDALTYDPDDAKGAFIDAPAFPAGNDTSYGHASDREDGDNGGENEFSEIDPPDVSDRMGT